MADPRHPRKFPEEFKRQIVQMYESGKPASEIYEEYDLCHSTLHRWVKGIPRWRPSDARSATSHTRFTTP